MRKRAHQFQVSIRVNLPRNVQVTKSLLNQALHYRATLGKDPIGFSINAIVWTVGARKYEYTKKDDVTEALNRMFRFGYSPTFPTVRSGRRVVQPDEDFD